MDSEVTPLCSAAPWDEVLHPYLLQPSDRDTAEEDCLLPRAFHRFFQSEIWDSSAIPCRAHFDPGSDWSLDRLPWEVHGPLAPAATTLYVYDLRARICGRFVLRPHALQRLDALRVSHNVLASIPALIEYIVKPQRPSLARMCELGFISAMYVIGSNVYTRVKDQPGAAHYALVRFAGPQPASQQVVACNAVVQPQRFGPADLAMLLRAVIHEKFCSDSHATCFNFVPDWYYDLRADLF